MKADKFSGLTGGLASALSAPAEETDAELETQEESRTATATAAPPVSDPQQPSATTVLTQPPAVTKIETPHGYDAGFIPFDQIVISSGPAIRPSATWPMWARNPEMVQQIELLRTPLSSAQRHIQRGRYRLVYLGPGPEGDWFRKFIPLHVANANLTAAPGGPHVHICDYSTRREPHVWLYIPRVFAERFDQMRRAEYRAQHGKEEIVRTADGSVSEVKVLSDKDAEHAADTEMNIDTLRMGGVRAVSLEGESLVTPTPVGIQRTDEPNVQREFRRISGNAG